MSRGSGDGGDSGLERMGEIDNSGESGREREGSGARRGEEGGEERGERGEEGGEEGVEEKHGEETEDGEAAAVCDEERRARSVSKIGFFPLFFGSNAVRGMTCISPLPVLTTTQSPQMRAHVVHVYLMP